MDIAMTRTPDGRGRERRTDTILPSVLSAREHGCPPPRPDTLPPRQGGRPSSKTESARALAAAALLALSGAFALPLTAEAQTEITLVSNIGQEGSGGLTGPAAHSQGFDTGSNATGYILTGVDVVSDDVKSFAVQVCETDSAGLHTSSCTDLTAPSTFAVGTMSFTVPPNTVLSTATTYAVVVTDDGTPRSWDATFTGDDDTGAADGWSIANIAYVRQAQEVTWEFASWALRIAVKGYARSTLSTDATLSGLSLGTGVTLSPTFASGTTIYTASVATAVDEVTVTPTTNHASATVEHLADGHVLHRDAPDGPLPDADATAPGHQVALGASTVIKVKVTAEDGTTTKTYQVTVTREAPADLHAEHGRHLVRRGDGRRGPGWSGGRRLQLLWIQTVYEYGRPDRQLRRPVAHDRNEHVHGHAA